MFVVVIWWWGDVFLLDTTATVANYNLLIFSYTICRYLYTYIHTYIHKCKYTHVMHIYISTIYLVGGRII